MLVAVSWALLVARSGLIAVCQSVTLGWSLWVCCCGSVAVGLVTVGRSVAVGWLLRSVDVGLVTVRMSVAVGWPLWVGWLLWVGRSGLVAVGRSL